MPEATGDDGNLGAGARRGNAAPRARRSTRGTTGSRGARFDSPGVRGATRHTDADDAATGDARCPGTAAGH